MEELSSKKRIRDDSNDMGFESLEVKRIKEELLENHDDNDWEIYAASHELESFMKSFEEDIASVNMQSDVVTYSTTEANALGPDMNYLLEASDDGLWLSPDSKKREAKTTELDGVKFDAPKFSDNLWGFGDEIPGFDSFDLGAINAENYINKYVVLDGLFDHWDPIFDFLDVACRHETLLSK